MLTQKFAITIDYPDELSSGDVREWVATALVDVADTHWLVVDSVGSHCYGYVLKGCLEVSSPREVSEEALKLLLKTSSERGPRLISLRLL